jgi:hypothetical protein
MAMPVQLEESVTSIVAGACPHVVAALVASLGIVAKSFGLNKHLLLAAFHSQQPVRRSFWHSCKQLRAMPPEFVNAKPELLFVQARPLSIFPQEDEAAFLK